MSKSNKIASLIIGRGNNTLKDKNVLPVLGRPLLQWGGLASLNSKNIGRHYISSDCDKILNAGKEIGFQTILRPDYLSTPSSQSADVVKHALSEIEKDGEIDILVVIHANVGTISSQMIDECIELLIQNHKATSVIPSHRKDEYHPLRARKLDDSGLLVPFVDNYDKPISANRQELELSLFYDHSFWVLDVERGVKDLEGQMPWPVMGKYILPYITEGCFDVHDLEDLHKTEQWIINNKVRESYQENGFAI